MALTQRMVDILKAIVDEFVSTAEPVGSKTLVDKYDLPYSSATIRNDMALLETMGYLEKPHTSAGRIPSNKGYQYYCEHLLRKDLDDEVKYALSSIFDHKSIDIDEAIKTSCKMVSEMTNLATGMLGPDAKTQTLEHIKVFQIDSKTAVCVFITSTGYTENKTLFKFILPQALRIVMPTYNSEVVSLVKSSSIVGYITVQDITRVSDMIRSRTYDAFFPLIVTAIIYFVLSHNLNKLINYLQKRFLPSEKSKEEILRSFKQRKSGK